MPSAHTEPCPHLPTAAGSGWEGALKPCLGFPIMHRSQHLIEKSPETAPFPPNSAREDAARPCTVRPDVSWTAGGLAELQFHFSAKKGDKEKKERKICKDGEQLFRVSKLKMVWEEKKNNTTKTTETFQCPPAHPHEVHGTPITSAPTPNRPGQHPKSGLGSLCHRSAGNGKSS